MTGAFGFTGRHIARRLLELGREVKTLTGHPSRADPFCGRVRIEPLDFSHPNRLRESLRGTDTLYTTYWVRFPHRCKTFGMAVANSQTLLRAAQDAGVRRLRGKGLVEKAIAKPGMSYGIVRPTLVFGDGDILLNNLAWFLRRFPFFPIQGEATTLSGHCS